MNVRNQVIGTAIMKMKLVMGAKSRNRNHKPDRTAANMPVTKVAKLFHRYPII